MTRIDYRIICKSIHEGARVLDLGCGDGSLLRMLCDKKKVTAQGIELKEKYIYECIKNGINVCQEDFEEGLKGYPDSCFDYVILNQSMQETRDLFRVIKESLRVGKVVIAGFPNFAHFRSRLTLLFAGKTPVTDSLPHHWYDTPNLHFFSLTDFVDLCKEENIEIIKRFYINGQRTINIIPNVFAQHGLFFIRSRE